MIHPCGFLLAVSEDFEVFLEKLEIVRGIVRLRLRLVRVLQVSAQGFEAPGYFDRELEDGLKLRLTYFLRESKPQAQA